MVDKMELDENILRKFVPCQTLPSAHLNDLKKGSKLLAVDRGVILFKATDHPKQAFYIVNGSVDLRDASGKKLSTIVADSREAQRALHTQHEQPVTAVSAENGRILMIDKNLLDLVLTWNQASEYVAAEIKANTNEPAENESDWMSSLLKSPLFTQVPAPNIQQLFTKFEPTKVTKGQTIITEGEPGDYFYVLSKGEAEVIRRVGTESTRLAKLEAGSLFGEEALISNAPRNASIIMLSDGLLMRLKKEDFTALLHKPLINHMSRHWINTIQHSSTAKITLIDVRSPVEFQTGIVEGSVNIPLPNLRSHLDSFDTDHTYVVICDGGRRSEIGAHILIQKGLNAYIYQA